MNFSFSYCAIKVQVHKLRLNYVNKPNWQFLCNDVVSFLVIGFLSDTVTIEIEAEGDAGSSSRTIGSTFNSLICGALIEDERSVTHV